MNAARLALSAALIATLGLAACGRKAPLDSPYEAQVQAAKDNKTTPPEKPVADKPFILDPLL
ncbi:hypothetical protein E0668_24130 [Salmonella enterica subsp. enterica]|nr:hypothetical protein [Salmonella enterica subsp. enterica]ECI7685961.1 hypothetical protein [Salmonella enterica subsp. enterica serovar Paratyphi A]